MLAPLALAAVPAITAPCLERARHQVGASLSAILDGLAIGAVQRRAPGKSVAV